ncbi:hypothetical protein PGUG_01063 [Meyerozyma guilliermondii ATCC 6260]|uniref:Histone-binding protein RBBP4-like N-terminal domain-containing protein n=1 Tax=Meyerozyma guilliermondii (strain ATCC 6260 / CBS 566 / DSM 6381 / JCM 1539 / NBRC 10279 / NRRL Y-324) TaxID=294746 RepID=A5DCQ8_PICGU|nr:uncharacterized protein PGUG_01063 [Meyerozyma guilliermondii ATCC 6260]EDK36965.2 hypothetical protein PGUG_01063 [Meyerozyma guilliermondii ATCC 6260]
MWCVGVIRVDFSKHFTLVARMSIQEAAEAVAAATEFENQPNEELSINEEYQLWRKNCRYMYEFVSETALTWPSLTIQWLPEHTIEGDAYESSLLLGTHTSGEDTNYLKIANTQIPVSSSGDKPMSRLKITKKFANNHEINRARYMPQDPNIVATINGGGEIDFYDRTDDSKAAKQHYTPHDENGYGLSWNPYLKGYLLTSSDDKSAIVSDYSKIATNEAQVFKTTSHDDIVNDAKWHGHEAHVFGSVSDDNRFRLFDIRASATTPVSVYHDDTAKGINTLSFSPFSHHLVALGNANSNIGLIDTRKLSSSTKKEGLLHTMMGHSDALTSMEFSPHKDGILATGSQDRRLILWDLFKIGEEQAQEDAEDGCPELFMMHAGHTGGVMDLSWCPYKDWTLGSVADDNIVHLWQVGSSLVNADTPEHIKPSDLE